MKRWITVLLTGILLLCGSILVCGDGEGIKINSQWVLIMFDRLFNTQTITIENNLKDIRRDSD